MPLPHLLLAGLLAVALLVPAAVAPASDPGYTDAFAPARNCSALKLPRRHVRGMRATPYRVCIRALESMQRNRRLSARRACRGETRRRVRGLRPGTPYSRCVAAGARMRRGR